MLRRPILSLTKSQEKHIEKDCQQTAVINKRVRETWNKHTKKLKRYKIWKSL